MTHNQLHWERVLQRTGHRVTRQRAAVLDAVCTGGGHKAMDEILAAVRRHRQDVDLATVYRALRLFIQVGLVVEAKTPGEEPRYEIAQLRPHHHLVCQQCGAECEVANDAVQTLVWEIYRRHQFQVANEHLVLYGVCAACTRYQSL